MGLMFWPQFLKNIEQHFWEGSTPPLNILAAVDFDLRCTYVLAAWEGSEHDALILADALQRPDGLKVPQGTYTADQHLNLLIPETMMSSDTAHLIFVRKILLG